MCIRDRPSTNQTRLVCVGTLCNRKNQIGILHACLLYTSVFSKKQAEELYSIAEKKGLLLQIALKTAYCPAFGHLFSLLKSGAVSYTHLRSNVVVPGFMATAMSSTLTDDQRNKI